MKQLSLFTAKKTKKSILLNLDIDLVVLIDLLAAQKKCSRTELIVFILLLYIEQKNENK